MVEKQSRMNIKEFIVDALIIGMSASFLWHFSNIWRYGQHLIQELNVVVKSLETAGLLFILAFGIYKLVYDLRRVRKVKRGQN